MSARAAIAAALLAGLTGIAAIPGDAAANAPGAVIDPFSGAKPGKALPGGWRVLGLPRVPAPAFDLTQVDGVTVLRAHAAAAAGTVAHALGASPAELPVLSWRWKIDRVVEGANLARKSGDDFAARVYVFFDMPLEALSFGDRLKALLARTVWGEELPTAAICYVWDNRHAPGTSAWNPYTDRVRTVVLRSGSPGPWAEEARDLPSDFRAAFGPQWPGPVPRVTGIAVGNDTDQTGETVTAWFGDFRLGSRR